MIIFDIIYGKENMNNYKIHYATDKLIPGFEDGWRRAVRIDLSSWHLSAM
jgi:hypothetical protein